MRICDTNTTPLVTAALKTVTDDTYAKFYEFHDIILRVKQQVKAQFGEDSNEAAGIEEAIGTQIRRAQKKKETAA